MAQTVSFDFKNAKAMATDADIAAIKDQVVAAKATLVNKTGEGNDFLDAVKFRFPIFFPVRVKKAQRDFPDGANALNHSKGDVLFFNKGNKAVMDFIAPLKADHKMGFINFTIFHQFSPYRSRRFTISVKATLAFL